MLNILRLKLFFRHYYNKNVADLTLAMWLKVNLGFDLCTDFA